MLTASRKQLQPAYIWEADAQETWSFYISFFSLPRATLTDMRAIRWLGPVLRPLRRARKLGSRI